jgi:hypothetical protein
MLKKFKTKELIFIALVAAFAFVIMFSLAGTINVITGTPLIGGLALNIIFSFIVATALLVVRKFGAASLMVLIYAGFSIPTTNFGPPGVYKLLMGLIVGIIIDVILFYANYKKVAYYIGMGLIFLLSVPLLYVFLILLQMPAAEKIASLIFPLMGVYLVEALIGTWLGFKFYKRIENKSFIKQIQS